ncbi:membrane-spanning 4-domains subfamily A member 4D [Xyrauchen texanus]|uniref:membrane-spanning 4-domains subfamily A member 4D n=1 Tax=Xyrauchen texanus TaxID=154827 RepID=UPI00224281E6|nr:membrane-spanning 4-domains subfamily A member 4D [Xyrauchen texanus]XP_052007249.1 membrane-spanning 4-domains subfamily A member 4D [Xyrauchen texanus]
MAEDRTAESTVEPLTKVTGGSKPLHRFLRGEPKSIGIVLMMMGVCLFMFGMNMELDDTIYVIEDLYCPFWLGTLFFICGLLYILSERNPTKKIITASFALSIVSTFGVIFACRIFSRSINGHLHMSWNYTEEIYEELHYMPIAIMELVFLIHSLIGSMLLVTMSFFARSALRSSRTQAVVVMCNLPSSE